MARVNGKGKGRVRDEDEGDEQTDREESTGMEVDGEGEQEESSTSRSRRQSNGTRDVPSSRRPNGTSKANGDEEADGDTSRGDLYDPDQRKHLPIREEEDVCVSVCVRVCVCVCVCTCPCMQCTRHEWSYHSSCWAIHADLSSSSHGQHHPGRQRWMRSVKFEKGTETSRVA